MRLTPEILEAAYDFLRTTPPFRDWKLPSPDDVEFYVGRAKDCFGWFKVLKGGKMRIAISERNLSHTNTLMRIMAHEMIHLDQHLRHSDRDDVQHNLEFRAMARQVCKAHGWDPLEFT